LFLAVFLLFFLGLAIIYSIAPSFALRQAVFLIPCLGLMFIFSLINYQSLKNYSLVIYFFCFLLLLGVLLFGHKIRGASSWFFLKGLTFQPVEIVKVLFVVILAKYFAKYYHNMHQLKHLIISALYTLILVFLVLIQPDLGSAFIIVLIWFFILLMAGTKKLYLFLLLVVFLAVAVLGWQIVLKDYQKQRIVIFLNPGQDPLGHGYNVIQSLIAVGSGGFFGRGLGYGSQSSLNFLPEAHTDFIFAVVAEELGFFGVVLVLGLFGLIFLRLVNIVKKASDNFARFLVIGVIAFFLGHILINIGMNLGIMPVIGIPLPFLSYGGSSLLASFAAIGLAQSVAVRSFRESDMGVEIE